MLQIAFEGFDTDNEHRELCQITATRPAVRDDLARKRYGLITLQHAAASPARHHNRRRR